METLKMLSEVHVHPTEPTGTSTCAFWQFPAQIQQKLSSLHWEMSLIS